MATVAYSPVTALLIPQVMDGPAAGNAAGNATGNKEASLIRQILCGQNDLLGDLIKPHMEMLRRFVRVKMGDTADVEDVVQQTVLKAFTHLNQFRFEACFRTWLIRIALNEVAQNWRKRASRHSARVEGVDLAALPASDRGDCPLHSFERNQTAKLLHHAISTLPEKIGVVVRMRDLEERSISDTAKALRLSVGAVKSRHHRGRLRMAQFLTRKMTPPARSLA